MAGALSFVRSMQRPEVELRFGFFEKALAVLGFLVLMGVLRVVLSDQSDRTAGSALFQIVAGGIYASAFGVMLLRGIPAWVFRTVARSWPLLLITLLALVSTLWSQDPDTSLRRAVALIMSTGFAVFLIARFELRTVVALLAVAFAIYFALSIVAAAIPGFGIVPSGTYAGAMRGVGGHKNSFGRTVALAVVLIPAAAAIGLFRARRAAVLLSAIAVGLLFLSRSATSLVSAFVGLNLGVLIYAAFGGVLGRIRLHPAVGAALLALTTIGGSLVVAYGIPIILTLLGRDTTLTGRTEIWDWAIKINEDRTLLGSGYRTFWIDENTKYFFTSFSWYRSDEEDDNTTGFHGPTHAHSGYVDVYLELGLVGIACLALLIASALVTIKKAISSGADRAGLLFSIMVSFLLVYATAANSILQQSEDLWFLFSLFYLLAVRGMLRGQGELPFSLRVSAAPAGGASSGSRREKDGGVA